MLILKHIVSIFLSGVASIFQYCKAFFSIYDQIKSDDEPIKNELRFQKVTDETIEWFNTILHRWWFFANTDIEKMVKEMMNDKITVLQHDKIESMVISRVDMSGYCPQGMNMHIREDNSRSGAQYMTNRGLEKLVNYLKEVRHHTVNCEVDLGYSGPGFDIEINCVIEKEEVKIRLKNCSISGKVNLKFSFDTSVPFPYISEVKLMFIENPRLNREIFVHESRMYLRIWINSKIDFILSQIPSNFEYVIFQSSHVKQCKHCLYGKDEAKGVVILSLTDLSLPERYESVELFNKINFVTISSTTQTFEIKNRSILQRKFRLGLIIANRNETVNVRFLSKSNIGLSKHCEFQINLSDYPLGVQEETVPVAKVNNDYEAKFQLGYIDLEPFKKDNCKTSSTITSESGIILIEIESAMSLKSRTNDITLDSYCEMFMEDHPVQSTEVIRNNPCPRWNLKISLLINQLSKTNLTFAVYNKSYQVDDQYDEIIGVFTYSLKEMTKPIENLQRNLRDFGNKGEHFELKSMINVNLQFISNTSFEDLDNFSLFDHECMKTNLDFSETERSDSNDLKDLQVFHLNVLEARNLIKADIMGSSDPFFEVYHNKTKIYTSKIMYDELNPVWNEVVTISSESLMPSDKVKIVVLDDDKLKKSDPLGECSLSTSDIYDHPLYNEPRWVELCGVKSGSILINITLEMSNFSNKKRTNQRKISFQNSWTENEGDEITSEHSAIDTLTDGSETSLEKAIENMDSLVLSHVDLRDQKAHENIIIKFTVHKLQKKTVINAKASSVDDKTLRYTNKEVKISRLLHNKKCKIQLIDLTNKNVIDYYFSKIGPFLKRLEIHHGILEMSNKSKIYFNVIKK